LLAWWCSWGIHFSGIHWVNGSWHFQRDFLLKHFDACRLDQYIVFEHQELTAQWHGIIFQWNRYLKLFLILDICRWCLIYKQGGGIESHILLITNQNIGYCWTS
jgi:hypothetical protein